ncbi:MAG: class II aldolase/adducin family protein [Erysipelotrichaceae bacterium]
MLESLKKDVCEIAKKAQKDGLCIHKSGNFSARDAQSGLIVMTPTAVDREVLTPRDLIVMDMDANVIENLSNLKPTSEALMHLTIYETRKDIMAIAHTHSAFATTFAIVNNVIPAIVYEIAGLGLKKARIPVAPYGRPGTPALAQSVIETCKEADCFLLEKHGVVCIDEQNIEEAYLKAAYVESLAQLYYQALMLNAGKEPDIIPQAELTGWQYPKEIKFNK